MKQTLTPGEHELVVRAERDLREASILLDKLEQCGEDCSLMKERLLAGLKRAEKVREHFAPQ